MSKFLLLLVVLLGGSWFTGLLFEAGNENFYEISGFEKLKPFVIKVQKKKCGKSKGFEIDFSAKNFKEVKNFLSSLESVKWKKGGVKYGEINVGWKFSEDVEYFRRNLKIGTEVVAISREKSKLWYIKNPH